MYMSICFITGKRRNVTTCVVPTCTWVRSVVYMLYYLNDVLSIFFVTGKHYNVIICANMHLGEVFVCLFCYWQTSECYYLRRHALG
jgi:hypothetical protein